MASEYSTSPRPTKSIVDGALLAKAQYGDHRAISEMARIAAAHISDMAGYCQIEIDEVTPFLVAALTRIAEGESPDTAFLWSKENAYRRPSNFVMWSLAQHVVDLRESGMPIDDAISLANQVAVGKGLYWGAGRDAYDKWAEAEMPEDVFPLTPEDVETIKKIDDAIAARMPQEDQQ